ncbi:MAG: hypothetical protein KKC68_07345 [Candidatus Thermoplasmatota archaeon]|nr:hypothetical protein [Candidatus Thermoplasmatota archaeon]
MRTYLIPPTIILTILLLATLSPATSLAPLSQSQNGTAHYVGGTGPGNYTTITDAINNATDHDTIYVYPGTYNESLTLDKPLTLTGHNPTTTILNSPTTAVTIHADQCTIHSFNITTPTTGIYITTAQRTQITGNYINHCTIGIHIDATQATPTLTNIMGNTIDFNDIGIQASTALTNIMHNDITHSTFALDLHCLLSNIILNHINNNINGIQLKGMLNNIGRNAITDHTTALILRGHINNIHHNNFLYNTENTYMELSFLNRFLNNFWTKPRFLQPYAIRGIIPLGSSEIAYYDFDPFPRAVLNTIPP